MNQNPGNPPPTTPEEKVIQATEKRKSRIGGFLAALGKTALAERAKKAATWLGTKLGLQGAITALGAAASGVTAGASLAISTAINLAIKLGKKVLGPIWKGIKSSIIRLVRKPEEALGWVAAGGLALAVLPMPIALVGVVPVTVGGMALVSWGVGSAGAIASGFAANTSAFFTTLTTAPTTAPIALLVTTILGTLALITFFIVITTAGAFILPVTPEKEITAYLEVTKSVNRNQIDNSELPTTIAYTITVSAKDAPIIITSIYDQRSINCQGSPPAIDKRIDIPPPSGSITNWSTSYPLDLDSSFADCSLCNTVTVIANVGGGPVGQMASDSLCVRIGNPPEDCPQAWPTTHGRITQGPNAGYSHSGQEAIDIGSTSSFYILGKDVYATHQGQVIGSGSYSCGGGIVKIQGSCNGNVFVSRFVHLNTIDKAVSVGIGVNRGQVIGTVGGFDVCSDGPHLHYQFDGLEMAAPYIPINDDILEGCCLSLSYCSKLCTDPDIYTEW